MPKFRITAPRFVVPKGAQAHMGRYVDASPSNPAIIELDESQVSKSDTGLIPVETEHVKPLPAHAGSKGGTTTGADMHSKPTDEQPSKDGKSGRASDKKTI